MKFPSHDQFPIPISAHSDVDTETNLPNDGQVLAWNSSNGQWEPGGVSAETSITDLNDVDTVTNAPENGQFLVWDGTNWVPGNTGEGAGIAVGDLVDVIITDAEEGDLVDGQGLRYNGTEWVNTKFSFSDLEGGIEVVSDTTPQLGGNLDVNGNQIVSTSRS